MIGTHFGCRRVTVSGKSPNRNITDEAMKAVADRGGLVLRVAAAIMDKTPRGSLI